MSTNKGLTIEEVKDIIKRSQLIYSFLSPASRRRLKKSFRDNPIKKLISQKDLHEYIDPSYNSSSWVAFELPDGTKETIDVEHSIPMILKNCKYLFGKNLDRN